MAALVSARPTRRAAVWPSGERLPLSTRDIAYVYGRRVLEIQDHIEALIAGLRRITAAPAPDPGSVRNPR
ncbi:hypothetical protein [Streptoalloteichus hindustanus]|nr:hypothetical protein [Streptoalloteichus hindustanus]